MNYHCILYVRTDLAKPSKEILLPRRLQRFKITDRDSIEGQISKGRLEKAGLSLKQPFRYFWIISSKGKISGSNILEHVEWIFSNFRPTFTLAELKIMGAEYGLSFYWDGGIGTGHGPIVTPELAELLAKHKVKLDFGIY
jgi:hypothetical protein